jgi:hypothetical protein
MCVEKNALELMKVIKSLSFVFEGDKECGEMMLQIQTEKNALELMKAIKSLSFVFCL